MDFKTTSWLERNHKKLLVLFVVGGSIYCLMQYLNMEDKSDTFLLASAYALYLFIIGLVPNYFDKKITDQYQERIEIYVNLKRVESFFRAEANKSILDLDSLMLVIIAFRVFTNRLPNDKTIPAYLKERGFTFNAKELIVEQEFIDLYRDLVKSIEEKIFIYLQQNDIHTKHRVSILDLYKFEPAMWCKDNLVDYGKYGRKVNNYLYSELILLRDHYSRLELQGLKIAKLYSRYQNRTQTNLRQIEKMYGRKLQYTIDQQSQLQYEFSVINEHLDEIDRNFNTLISEHDEKIENYVSCLDGMSSIVETISMDIDEVKDIVTELRDDRPNGTITLTKRPGISK